GGHTGERKKAGDPRQVRKRERPPKPALKQPGHEDSLAGAADASEHRGHETLVAHGAGSKRARHKANNERWTYAPAEDNQEADSDSGHGAERGHTGRPRQQCQPEFRHEEKDNGKKTGPAERGRPDASGGSRAPACSMRYVRFPQVTPAQQTYGLSAYTNPWRGRPRRLPGAVNARSAATSRPRKGRQVSTALG